MGKSSNKNKKEALQRDGRGDQKNRWKRSLPVILSVFLFGFFGMTAQGARLTPWMINGNGDFVIWYCSSLAETWITDVFAADQSDILDRITLVQYYDTSDFLTDLETIQSEPGDSLYPDLIFLEPYYAAQIMETQGLLSADDLGITQADMSNMFPYTIDNGTDEQGNVRVFFCSAAPGAFQVRADLAAVYLGTRDPEQLHDLYFSDWKKMMATARRVYIESDGMVSLIPGYMELYAGLAMPVQDFSWVDENNVLVDAAQIARMMRFSQGLDRYTPGATQWDIEWMDLMNGDGVDTPAAIAYAGTAWFTGYCLGDGWLNNAIIIEGPADFQWGGQGIAATAGCSDVDLAAEIIKTLCCDADAMAEMTADGELVNNREALENASALGYGECDYLYHRNQDLFQTYLPLAENTAGNQLTAYSSKIRDLYLYSLQQYINGNGGMEESIERGEEIRDALEEMIVSH